MTAALRDSKSPYELVQMPVLTLEPHKRRRRRPRWPHQRLAAGLAQHRVLNVGCESERPPQTQHPSVTTPNGSGNIHQFVGGTTPYEANISFREDIPPDGDLGHGNEPCHDDLDASDEPLEHGLVALPVFPSRQLRRETTSTTAGDEDVDLEVPTVDAEENEERYNLKYYKKPFFSRF